MTTPLFPQSEKRIQDAFNQLIKNQVIPWVFMGDGGTLDIKQHDGKWIHYRGIRFEGSPRNVFWSGYIEPFIEEICLNQIDAAMQKASERDVSARALLREVQSLLLSNINKTYLQMADVHFRLQNRLDGMHVEPSSLDKPYRRMKHFVDRQVDAELSMWKPRSRLQYWYDNHKALTSTIGVGASVIGIAANLL